MESKISVIIPNYNRAKVIGETLDALINQTLKPHEIIVVDDGSTDNSIEVLKAYGNKITLIQQQNLGPAVARNKGFLNATGDFISFMDSDDVPSLNKLEVQSKRMIADQADVVIGPWYRVNFCDKHTIKGNNLVLQNSGELVEGNELAYFLSNWSFVFQQTLIRRRVIETVGLYDENLILTEDADLSVRIFASNFKIVYENESLLLYRLDDFGKLTSSGISNFRAIENHCKWLLKVVSLPQTKEFITAKSFQTRLFSWVHDYKQFSEKIDLELLKSLEPFVKISKFEYQKLKFVERLTKGAQQRLIGHRWSKAYQVSELSERQKVQINELGYNIGNDE